nr:MAG TPA: hypothetical protein [Caudoviricetes sp.]
MSSLQLLLYSMSTILSNIKNAYIILHKVIGAVLLPLL